ncbi:MAG TPA: hypothetical protein VLC47_07470 [Burkholderiales bacterium]|nr:hypothetical protein [Burkholderiales bacterium]
MHGRSRAAHALLAGWLAFWLFVFVQPWCWAAEVYGPADHVATLVVPHAGAADVGHDGPPADPCCVTLSSAAVDDGRPLVPAPQGAAERWSAPPPLVAAAPKEARPPEILWFAASPPPSRASPLYLRTHRLRI